MPSSGKIARSTWRDSPSRINASVSSAFALGSPTCTRGVHPATRTNPCRWIERNASFLMKLSTPDFPGGFHDEPHLVGLLLARDLVAVHGARESALRREAELLERRVLRRLVDAPLDGVLRLELAELGGDEAQHHGLALRQEAQRPEVPGALVVVLEEVAVHGELVEEDLGHRLVAAFADPCALEVAAAQVRADGHPLRPVRDRGVDELRVVARQLVRVEPAPACRLAHVRVAE